MKRYPIALVTTLLVAGACQPPDEPSLEVGMPQEAIWRPTALAGDGMELPDARDVVLRMTEFMGNHDDLWFQALVTYEAVQEDGRKLNFDLLQQMAIRRPDRLFWMTLRDDGSTNSAWFYRGDFTLLKQPANIWGQVDLSPNITEAVESLVYEYNLDVPFADMLMSEAGELWLGEEVTSMEYVGEAWVEGYWTDHIALRMPGADVQVWVRQGAESFPSRLNITYTEEEGQPSYSARFRNWGTTLPEGALPAFVPPPESEELEVVAVYD
jgi:hypothetical protein